jgi:hypothetical protein
MTTALSPRHKNALVIWTEEAHTNSGTATEEVIQEQATVLGQEKNVTNLVQKSLCMFFVLKNEIMTMMTRPAA